LALSSQKSAVGNTICEPIRRNRFRNRQPVRPSKARRVEIRAGLFDVHSLLQLKVVIDERPQPSRVLVEKQINALDPELMDLANDPTVIFLCHNAGFEQAMWKYHMVPMGYPSFRRSAGTIRWPLPQ
jgi:hypothetical protein